MSDAFPASCSARRPELYCRVGARGVRRSQSSVQRFRFGDNIQNYSTNPYRRVDRTAQLNGSVDANAAMALLRAKLLTIPNVVANPAPEVDILDSNLVGPVLAVRPFTHNTHYWQVYFDTNKLVRECFGEAGYPAPEQKITIRQTEA